MNKIYANTVNEIEKIFSRKKTIVFLILTAVITLLTAMLIPRIQDRFGIMVINAPQFPVTLINLFSGTLLPLFVLMVTTDLFSGEVHDKSLKLVLLRPVSRLKVYISKILAIFFYIIANLFIIFSAALICDFIYKFGGSYSEAFLYGVTAFITDIFPQLILVVFMSFICGFFNSSTGAVITNIFILVVLKIISFLFPILNKVIFINYLDWSSMWLGASAGGIRILTVFILLLSYGIIFFTAGYFLFDRKDI